MKPSAKHIGIQLWALSAIICSLIGSSCQSIIGDDLEPCPVEYRIKFKYDRNLKYADAFANEVTAISLYAFNEDGSLAHQQSEAGSALQQEGYTMSLNFNPDNYHLVVWGGLVSDGSFSIPTAETKDIKQEDISCKLARTHQDGVAVVTEDLTPLFHGLAVKASDTRSSNTLVKEISLTKNTNNVRIVLQQMSGDTMDANQFHFFIHDNNGWLSYSNQLLNDEELAYYPWRVESASTEVSRSNLNVLLAEFTVGRLMEESKATLTVLNDAGETIFSIPLIQYALLVKGYYNREMDNQEYLDRQDEYNFTFFLDSNHQWISSSVIINGWKVVLNESDLN